jgi:Putative zinc-finger
VSERERDRSVDAVLRRVLAGDVSASPQAHCLDGETFGAWMSGSLSAEAAAAVERHVAACGRCRTLTAVFVQTARAGAARESIWRRWRLGWVVPLATAATAAALWVALPGNALVYRPQEGDSKAVSRDAAVGPVASSPPVPSAPEPAAPATPPRQEAAAPREEKLAPPPTTASNRVDETAGREVADQRAPAAPPSAQAELEKREVANSAPQPFAARLAPPPPSEISAPGGAARWRILGQQVDWSTTAGNAWEPVTIMADDLLTSGAAPSPSVCWIVGRRGAVYLTTDGARFMRLPFPEIVDLVSVTATDDRRAAVSAADGRSWQTSDQGVTWSMER